MMPAWASVSARRFAEVGSIPSSACEQVAKVRMVMPLLVSPPGSLGLSTYPPSKRSRMGRKRSKLAILFSSMPPAFQIEGRSEPERRRHDPIPEVKSISKEKGRRMERLPFVLFPYFQNNKPADNSMPTVFLGEPYSCATVT